MNFLFATFFSFDTARLDTLNWVNNQVSTSAEWLIQTGGHLMRDYVNNIGVYLGTLF